MRPAGVRRGLQLPAGSGRRYPDVCLQGLTGVLLFRSYNLSCELEPEGQRAGRKWLLQFFKSDKI